MNHMEIHRLVSDAIKGNKIAVFGNSGERATRRARETFRDMGYEYWTIDLDQTSSSTEISYYLRAVSGQHNTPYIFLNHRHFGDESKLNTQKQTGQLVHRLGPSPASSERASIASTDSSQA